jgi:hypothetical protein
VVTSGNESPPRTAAPETDGWGGPGVITIDGDPVDGPHSVGITYFPPGPTVYFTVPPPLPVKDGEKGVGVNARAKEPFLPVSVNLIPVQRLFFDPTQDLTADEATRLTELKQLDLQYEMNGFQPLKKYTTRDAYGASSPWIEHTERFHKMITDGWISDAFLDYYMNMLLERSIRRRRVYGTLNCAFYSFHFEKQSETRMRYRVQRNRRQNILPWMTDLSFFPAYVHGNHFCLGIVDARKRLITYYDSLGERNDTFVASLVLYMKLAWEDIHGKSIACPELKTEYAFEPAQKDSKHCGAFVAMYANYASQGYTWQERSGGWSRKMDVIRNRMWLDAVRGYVD